MILSCQIPKNIKKKSCKTNTQFYVIKINNIYYIIIRTYNK